MDSHHSHQSTFGRPQPQPHQHPVDRYGQQQQFSLPDAGSLDYASSSNSGSDWGAGGNSFFSDPSSRSSDYASDLSSVGSFGPSSSSDQIPLSPAVGSFEQQHYSPNLSFDPYAFAPSLQTPRFAKPYSGSNVEFSQGRAIVEPDTLSGGGYEGYGVQDQRFQQVMAAASPMGMQGGGGMARQGSFAEVMSMPAQQLSPQVQQHQQQRSNAFSFASEPAAIGMMGPPPRPSQRAYSTGDVPTYPKPQPPPMALAPPGNAVYTKYGDIPYAEAQSPQSKAVHNPPSAASFSMNPTSPSDPFDAQAMGLPSLQANQQDKSWTGVYSTTGFDMVSVLARVASRPNPQIALGPVDLGCSFVVVDAKKWDQPIVFASETFSRLTGYSNVEIIGRNCRFLQAPDGVPVRQGEKRKYTDGNAAHHLRRGLVSGQESQASLINYRKCGKPFINLVTLIPITWDSDEIAYFVGFQVDLVEQPSAIMEKMRDGSYVVNYSVSVNSIPASLELPHVEPFGDALALTTGGPMDVDPPSDIINVISESGLAGLSSDVSKKQFNRMLLEHCDDFVHVLSLKGSLLYVSPSAKRMLEYEPAELIGKPLSSVCHPSDIVSVLRELKEAGPNTPVNIVYRVRRKTSGYVWLEATGKLHLEQGKGRKCVILVGRPREVYRMSWGDLERLGGFGSTEYWSKMTVAGLYLYSTPNVEKVLGLTSDAMTGKTLAQLSPNGDASAVLDALRQASHGQATTARHQMISATGVVDVVTHFYPAKTETDVPASPMPQGSISNALTIIAQTNLFSSEVTKPRNVSLPSAPSSRSSSSSGDSVTQSPVAFTLPSFSSGGSDGDDSSTSGSSSSFSAITSTFKQLTPSASISDNVFDELDSVRGTSWQFELHQMRLTNKKLREEKEALLAMQRKKRKRAAGGDKLQLPPGASPSGKSGQRTCANCGRSSSAEWRTGPTGPKTLCNACGLRWSKVRPTLTSNNSTNSNKSSGSSGGASGSRSKSTAATPPIIPLMSPGPSRSPSS